MESDFLRGYVLVLPNCASRHWLGKMDFSVGLVLGASEISGGGYDYERSLVELLSKVCRNLRMELRVFRADKHGEVRETITSEMVASKKGWLSLVGGRRSLVSSSKQSINLDKLLEKEGISVVYFGSPNRLAEQVSVVPIISTVWDLGHRELPDFPEFRGSTWQARENLYRTTLPRSSHVFVDSNATAQSLQSIYGVLNSRISPLGLLYQGPGNSTENVIPDFQPDSPYFIYPAKKWPHKNHELLLGILGQLVREIPGVRLVLTGASAGKFSGAVESRISSHPNRGSIVDLGFIREGELTYLIKNATALVMPTFLGPTNLPPLQALALGTPALVSDVHHFEQGLQEKMIVLPKDNPEAWLQAMVAAQRKPTSRIPVQLSISEAESEVTHVLSRIAKASAAW